MNVRKKMKLSHVFESYWDMLPPEIHDFILLLKSNQELIDEEKKRRMRELSKEIILYKKLKDEWALGHVRCVVECYKCCYQPCMRIYGCYVNEENVKRERFLGISFTGALQRLDHIKSLM